MPAESRMISLGFGKFARADRIFALEPLVGEERGDGRRTRVWVEGIPNPIIASRTESTASIAQRSCASATSTSKSDACSRNQARSLSWFDAFVTVRKRSGPSR